MAIVSVVKAAELVGVSTSTIYNRISSGDLQKADYNAISTKELERFYGPLDKKAKRNVSPAAQARGNKGAQRRYGCNKGLLGDQTGTVSILEAANLVGVSTKTIYKRIGTGELQKAGRNAISIKELERFYGPLAQQQESSSAEQLLKQEIECLKKQVAKLEHDKMIEPKESFFKKLFKAWRKK